MQHFAFAIGQFFKSIRDDLFGNERRSLVKQQPRGGFDSLEDTIFLRRLFDKVHRPSAHRLDSNRHVAIPCHKYNWDLDVQCVQMRLKL